MNCYLFVKNLRIEAVYFHRNHAACARKKTLRDHSGSVGEGGSIVIRVWHKGERLQQVD
jgi:hypothetical protein